MEHVRRSLKSPTVCKTSQLDVGDYFNHILVYIPISFCYSLLIHVVVNGILFDVYEFNSVCMPWYMGLRNGMKPQLEHKHFLLSMLPAGRHSGPVLVRLWGL